MWASGNLFGTFKILNGFKVWKLRDVRIKGKTRSCFGTPMQTLDSSCGFTEGSWGFTCKSVLPSGMLFVQVCASRYSASGFPY